MWGDFLEGEIRLAYLAGFVDGEGCIAIVRRRHKRKNCDFWTYEPQLVVVNKDRRPLEMFVKEFGGWLFKGSVPDTYQYRLSFNNLKTAMERLLPYLVTKRERAALLLEFYSTMGNYGKSGYPLEIKERRDAMYLRMVELTGEFNIRAKRRSQNLAASH